MPDLWDPLTYENLMAGTVAHFETQTLRPLENPEPVEGPGIYALYYKGHMPEYRSIATGQCPIYVGKAVPPGTRKGGLGNVDAPAIRNRLRQHLKSIRAARNLDPKDFSIRVLAIVPVWIVFAEQALIKRYRPVWNSCLEGFGKHDQGVNRIGTLPSWWDTLHTGRPWARPLVASGSPEAPSRTVDEARARLRTHFAEAESL